MKPLTGIRSRVMAYASAALNVLDNVSSKPWSGLVIHSDLSGWVLDTEARGLLAACGKLNIPASLRNSAGRRKACVHYMTQFTLLNPEVFFAGKDNRYSLAYFHGGPSEPGFGELFSRLLSLKNKISKVHVANRAMDTALLENGIAQECVARIPIGINIEWFKPKTALSTEAVRKRLGIPSHAFVLGSFQKDGVGWGEGFDPKLIKGPDTLVDVCAALKKEIPGFRVLLSGPARGFVKKGLGAAGVPFTHVLCEHPHQVAELYHALNVYAVTSRVEGGPKAVLESMATGVPLVTTEVGQAADLVRHTVNGWMVKPGDVGGLVDGVMAVHRGSFGGAEVSASARATAEREDYVAQAPRWEKLFINGYVER